MPDDAPVRVLVVDDEPLARSNIVTLLRRDPGLELVGECQSGAEAVAAIVRTRPDLIFLDVQMPECDGFDVLERVGPGLQSEVVFVTAYDQHAVRAFEAGALDYLVKPFTDQRFAAALDRVTQRILQRRGAPQRAGRLLLKSPGRIVLAKLSDVDWIEASDYYASVHIGGATHVLRCSLSRLERELDPSRFCRIHRSAIVNLSRVQAMVANQAGEYDVLLEGGQRLRLSRRYRKRLQARLAR
ncbi:MAG: LytR/AlgR family response regulator transcription factor [Betaproteobacteria bacterium]